VAESSRAVVLEDRTDLLARGCRRGGNLIAQRGDRALLRPCVAHDL
jgi:hypothetical protein